MISIIATETPEAMTMNLIEKSRILCSNQERQVRKIMCCEILQPVIKATGRDQLENFIFEKIMELVYDSQIEIKVSAIKMLFTILDEFSPQMQTTRLLQVYLDLLKSKIPEVQKITSFLMGKVLYTLKDYFLMNPSLLHQLLTNFKDYGSSDNPEFQYNFVYNFSAICSILAPGQFEQFIKDYLNLLLNSKNEETKLTGAAQFHAVVKIINKQTDGEKFRDAIVMLIGQGQLQVQRIIVETLEEILRNFEVNNQLNCEGDAESFKVQMLQQQQQVLNLKYATDVLAKVISVLPKIQKMIQ